MNHTQSQTCRSVVGLACLLMAAAIALAGCRAPVAGVSAAAAQAPLPCPVDDCPADYAAMAGGMPLPPPPEPMPLPAMVMGTWSPEGIGLPWPPEEYLRDGGDHGAPVAIAPDWTIYNLGLEDTVCHFDTLDGRTLVKPSNCVMLYAPRFGAVRTVTRLAENEQADLIAGMNQPLRLGKHEEVDIAATSLQRVQPERQANARIAGAFRTRQWDSVLTQILAPAAFQDAFLPYENLVVLRTGEFSNLEKARLSTSVQRAITWTADAAVQVLVDNQALQVVTGDRKAQATFGYEDRSKPCLRIIKVASTDTALPGETVDFTLRVDNTGTQVVGNVVVLDNLTTRLEYSADSAQASVPAEFSVRANEGGSLVLRWELRDPIEPGDGCVLRFRCVVR